MPKKQSKMSMYLKELQGIPERVGMMHSRSDVTVPAVAHSIYDEEIAITCMTI
jgi:hypothetical protein